HDDVRRLVDRRLRVVAGVEAAARARHEAAVGGGEVVLILVLGHAEGSFVAAALGLAVRATGLLLVVVAAPALEVRVALALLQSGAGRGDGIERGLSGRHL